jgi:hypothetical protein
LAFFLAIAGLSACAGRDELAQRIGRAANLSADVIDVGAMRLVAFERDGAGAQLSVYIEGDGFTSVTLTRLSSDPTPRDPVALRLAAADGAPAVLYLARPCQFPSLTGQRHCDSDYWSVARYAPLVVETMDAAISKVMRRTGKSRVELIGYSGGGVIAALIAARRNDVVRVITIAADLDVTFWTTYHNVSPLTKSLNPADETALLRDVPQIALTGGRDEIVPKVVLDQYVSRFPRDRGPSVLDIPNFTHECCWADDWSILISQARAMTPAAATESK